MKRIVIIFVTVVMAIVIGAGIFGVIYKPSNNFPSAKISFVADGWTSFQWQDKSEYKCELRGPSPYADEPEFEYRLTSTIPETDDEWGDYIETNAPPWRAEVPREAQEWMWGCEVEAMSKIGAAQILKDLE